MAQSVEAAGDVAPDYFVIAPGCKQEDFWRRKGLDADRWAGSDAALTPTSRDGRIATERDDFNSRTAPGVPRLMLRQVDSWPRGGHSREEP